MNTPLQHGPETGLPDHESSFTRFRRRITESRYFMLSLFVHGIIVIVAGSIVIFRTVMPVEDFVPTGEVTGCENPVEPIELPIEKPLEPRPNTQQPMETGGPSLEHITTKDIGTFILNPGKSTGPILFRSPGMPDTDIKTPLGSVAPKGIDLTFRSRFGEEKIRIGKQKGMTDRSRTAVERSLKWLRENQNADGSWGDNSKGAMTGLALLCYLGYGELPDSKEYGYTIGAAVNWILENGTKFEGRLGMEKTFTQTGVYEHGIATYALGEYYAITHDGRVLELLRQAVAHIVQGQGPGGGWMYGFDKTANDLSVGGWQIQALKAAHLTGLKLPGVEQALDKAISYIEAVKGPKGGYGYRAAEDRYSLSGVGILSSLFWKGERGELRKGMEWLIDETAKNRPVKYMGQSADLYAWYYHTQACLMFGDPAWKKWNRWFQDELCNAQSTDGSWPIPGAKGHGPQADPGRTGQVYRTTLCTLMLEVFYRYMHTHRG